MDKIKYDEDGFLLSKKTAENVSKILDNTEAMLKYSKLGSIATQKIVVAQRKDKSSKVPLKNVVSTRKYSKPNTSKNNQTNKTKIHRQTPEERREHQAAVEEARENKKQTDLLEEIVKQGNKSSGWLSKLGLGIAALASLLRSPKSLFGGGKNGKGGFFGGGKDGRKRDEKGRFVKSDAPKTGKLGRFARIGRFAKGVLKGGALTALFAGLDAIDVESNTELTREQKNKKHARNLTVAAGGTAGMFAGAAIGSAVFPGVGTVIGGLLGGFLGAEITDKVVDVASDFFENAIDPELSAKFFDRWNNFVNVVSSKWSIFTDFAKSKWQSFSGFVTEKWDSFSNFITEKWDGISGFVTEKWDTFSNFVTEKWDGISGFVTEKWGEFSNYLSEEWGWVADYAAEKWSAFSDFISEKWNSFTDSVSKSAMAFWDKAVPDSWKVAITDIKDKAKSVFNSFADDAKSFWGHLKDIFNAGAEVVEAGKDVAVDAGEKSINGNKSGQSTSNTQNGEKSASSLEKELIASGKLADNSRSGDISKLRKDVPESVSGGLAHKGTYAFANVLAKDKDINAFTAFKDSYHIKANSKSKHNQGLAFDVTYKNAAGGSGKATINEENAKRFDAKINGMTKMLEAAGLQNGVDFKIINEYDPKKVAKHTTGGHVHFEFANEAAAERYFSHIYGNNQQTKTASIVNDSGKFEKSHQLNGKSNNAIIARTFESKDSVRKAQDLMRRFNAGKIGNLSEEETAAYAAMVAATESAYNYKVINDKGYVGAYQFGAQALEDIGLLKAGSYKKYGNKAIHNADNWTTKGGLDAFLNSTTMQDKAFVDYSNKNIKYLKDKGITDAQIGNNGDLGRLMFMLKASHLAGAGGLAKVLRTGKDFHDAYGTSAKQYGEHATLASGLFLSESRRLRNHNGLMTVARPANIATPPYVPRAVQVKSANVVNTVEPITVSPITKTSVSGGGYHQGERDNLVAHQIKVGRTVSNPSIAHLASGGIMDNHVR